MEGVSNGHSNAVPAPVTAGRGRGGGGRGIFRTTAGGREGRGAGRGTPSPSVPVSLSACVPSAAAEDEEPVAPPSMFAAEPRTSASNNTAGNSNAASNAAAGRGGRGRGGRGGAATAAGKKNTTAAAAVPVPPAATATTTVAAVAEIAVNPPKPPPAAKKTVSATTAANSAGKPPSSSSSSSSSSSNTNTRIKLTVRKLPPTCEYTAKDLERDLHAVVDRLLAPTPQRASEYSSSSFAEERAKEIAAQVEIEHVVEGKISRKRGPVYGAAFVSISSSLFQAFVTRCPQEIPLLADTDAGAQPEVSLALHAKPFRPREKEKADPLCGTYLEDPDFLAFKERSEKPVQKLSPADIQMDLKKTQTQTTATLEERLKNNSLLQYMHEKAQKKVLSRSVLSITQSASGKSLSAKEIQRAERKEKKREKRRKKELGVSEEVGKEKKKKKNRERKKKELSDAAAPVLGSQKLLVLKRENPSDTGGESQSTKSEKAPKPRKEKAARREKKKERDAENAASSSAAAAATAPAQPTPWMRVLLKRDAPLPPQT